MSPARWFRDLPIRRKLRGITILAAGAPLLFACGSFVAYDMVTFRRVILQQVSTEAEIIARQSAAALVFKDPDAAAATLEALKAEPHVLSAGIYTAAGAPFASYARSGRRGPPPRPPAGEFSGQAFAPGRLVLFRPIVLDGSVIGTALIESDLTALTGRLQRYALIALGVLLASSLVGHWLAARLQRGITGPVQHLAATAEAISSRQDYSVRASARGRDELGQLVDAFNHMLEQIQQRDHALHESEEKYRLLFDGNPNPMWVHDPDTLAILAVNDAAVRVYGHGRDEFLALTVADVYAPADEPSAPVPSPGPPPFSDPDGNWRHRRRDGSLFDVEVASSAIAFDGRPARLVMATDVSEKRRLESQLLQSQKMEAVGRLAGGVAHDFNNLLGVITGYSDLLRRSLRAQDPGQKRIEQIQKAAERAAGLTRQLLAFSRKEVIQPKVLQLNEVVSNVEKMLQRLIGEDVCLFTRLDPDLGHVQADRGQIDQILLNLAVNARDAMPHGGDILIETSNTSLDEMYLRAHADVAPGPYVLLSVSDTGHGMDAETLSHVFEPFFTTKGEGQGTGLGLSTVFGIVKQSGGHVGAYSEPGRGSTFRVYLPRVDASASESEAQAAAVPPPRGTETVLLVEDAEALRPMIHEILESAGYRVLESSDAEEAVLRAGSHQGPLDLILTDVIMPRLSGPEVVRAVQAMRPGVKALFMSGYTNDAIGRQGVLEPGVHLLQKPFTSGALLGSVREVLDQGAPAAH